MEDYEKPVIDENPDVQNPERLPIKLPIKVLRYRTIKKNDSFGWWSAVVLVEDHDKKQMCFYRWHKKGTEWRRDKKLPIKNKHEWYDIKSAFESFVDELDI